MFTFVLFEGHLDTKQMPEYKQQWIMYITMFIITLERQVWTLFQTSDHQLK